MLNSCLEFFKSYSTEDSYGDCTIQMDDVLVVLAYPMVILIGPAPTFDDAVVDVKKDGLDIGLGKYPIVKFLEENPDGCMKIVEEHNGLKKLFDEWVKKEQEVSFLS